MEVWVRYYGDGVNSVSCVDDRVHGYDAEPYYVLNTEATWASERVM